MGFSDFVDNVRCAIGAKCKAQEYTAKQVANVLTDISETIQNDCFTTQTLRQSLTCPVIANSCSNMSVVCGATATQSFDCTLSSAVDLYAQAAAKIVDAVGDEQRVLRSIGKDIRDASVKNIDLNEQVTTLVSDHLKQVCSSSQSANQFSQNRLMCDTSSHITASFLANIDMTSGCVLVEANRITRDATQPVNRTVLALGLFGGGIVVLLLLALGVFFAARGRSRSRGG
jgi:hypothetical protein